MGIRGKANTDCRGESELKREGKSLLLKTRLGHDEDNEKERKSLMQGADLQVIKFYTYYQNVVFKLFKGKFVKVTMHLILFMTN